MTRSEWLRPLQTFTVIPRRSRVAQHQQTNAVPCLLEPWEEDHGITHEISLANSIDLILKPSAFASEVFFICHDTITLCSARFTLMHGGCGRCNSICANEAALLIPKVCLSLKKHLLTSNYSRTFENHDRQMIRCDKSYGNVPAIY